MIYKDLKIWIIAFIGLAIIWFGMYYMSKWSGGCKEMGGPSWMGGCIQINDTVGNIIVKPF